MHQHGPDELVGPVRGSSAWWRGADAAPTTANDVSVREQPCEDGAIRTELVARVRRDIAAGAYDRPEIWERTLDRLLDRLDEV
jgi:hypothetical protein